MSNSRGVALAMIVAGLLCFMAAACGSKNKGEEDAGPDTTDATDLGEDADAPLDGDAGDQDGTEPDAGDAGEDVAVDTSPDTEPDVVDVTDVPEELDCVPGTSGNPPPPVTEACGKVATCIDLEDPAGTAWDCMLMSLFGDWQPAYGAWNEILLLELVTTLWGHVHSNTTCLDTASGCDEVFDCLNGGAISAACDMPSGNDASVWPTGCSAGGTVYCVETDPLLDVGREIVIPCPEGQTCHSIAGVYAGCFLSDCSTADPDPVCRGGNIDRCVLPGVHAVYDCDALSRGAGGDCMEVDDGTGTLVATCVPPGTVCDTATFTQYCTDDIVSRCAEGYEYDTDCATIAADWFCNPVSGECAPDVSAWTCTVGEAGLCDCTDAIICDPTVGQDIRLHCPDYGMRLCDDSSGRAVCAP